MNAAKPKILVTREVFDDTLDYLREHCTVLDNQADVPYTPQTLAAALADCEGLVCALTDRVDAALLAAAPKLKAVANIAVGYNNIDVQACTARRVLATNTPGVLDDSTADLAWTLMLGTARRITEVERRIRAGEWTGWRLKQWLGVDVHHATLGIVGMGRIGQAIARRALGFEMNVLYHNRKRIAPELEARCNARYASLEELLAQSDFVVLQVPYSPQTHHLIGAAQIAKMKPGAILINSTRGGVVDDSALVEALKNGVIRGAGLDVFENEPKLNPGFLQLDNVVLAPHIGSSTEATRRAMAMLAARNLVAALGDAMPPNPINPEAHA
ncbi:MAG: 2-hydroxyacid dehydrogenase [Betaproteobacteria bacterium]|jgi:gluconate 2-dehydrogenase|nr:D-glycerate dehydrogenase [Betaproteobacteria bacterium]